MTKKDLLAYLKQNMPEGLTELEKARYLYLEIGKQKAYDERCYYGNRETRRKIYRLARDSKDGIKKMYNRKRFICTSLSYLYQSILKEFGIDSEVNVDEEFHDGHMAPVINLKDGRKIKADLQLDLENIQAGMQTTEFGSSSSSYYCVPLDQEEIKKIDKKLGYIKDDYRDKDIEAMHKKVAGMNATDMLKTILESPEVYDGVHFTGQVERRKYYNYIIEKLASEYKDSKIYIFTCYREKEKNGEPKRDYTLCAYSYENKNLQPYLYSQKEERFVHIEPEKLNKLHDEGLVFGTRQHTMGAKLLKKIMQNNVRKSIDTER